ncbi:type II toxin-antitoxin system prevent-host-death family antitoxin [Endozoicomonas sp. SM1973]|uniref:Type II toxin-antitoxin system prevent-host-death family antitoxin n=1 Tax=Spartinivicinus marinus TaxID=2994442 RepID=A0A853IJQ9_9GAMM|nr:type II toxin-antitoxin system prevent-host-death family antitoxin [Spartinivicinus marinus]NYZ69627.1 type II toxin-antitoxin system prevent-host-death family antitoxin [Spartinivicinus marinus]
METHVSKGVFKAKALEIMRGVEETGNEVVITSHGKPCLVVKPFKGASDPLQLLKGTVISFDNPTDPVADDEWELA